MKKCRFFERGYCKKNPCNFFHPVEGCRDFSLYGQCRLGQNCRLRHPFNVCMRYLEGSCNLGFTCVNQHPANNSPVRPQSPLKPPSLPYPPQSPPRQTYPRVYPESNLQQRSPSFNIQQQTTPSPTVMSNQVFW